jgi:glyoxylase-like metal-dependent hydrolase (beta-lactamase superfamily II)
VTNQTAGAIAWGVGLRSILIFLFLFESITLTCWASQPDPFASPCKDTPVELKKISGNLYRHTIGSPAFYGGLVLITKEGAVVVDPARTCTSMQLRDKIKSEFHVPVKYVIYSHAHFDHIGGSQVFKQDGATIIAHENTVEPIVGEKLPTAPPDKLFSKEMKIELGGETIELHHIAPSHSNSLTLVYFPKYRALQCTDVCGSDSMPYNDLPDFYYEGWIETLRWVLKQDVDVIDDGHHALATKKQQQALLEYMTDLHDQVLALVREGQPWDEVYRNVKFKESYKKWTSFNESKMLNVLGMHRWVTQHRRGVW